MSEPILNGPPRTTSQRRKASAQRFELLNAFWDKGTARTLTRTEALVWLALYRHARPDRSVCASHQTIANMIGIRRETAYRAVCRLRQKRLLKLERRGGPDQRPNVYKLLPYVPITCLHQRR
jgi:hypothetical protein